MEGLCGRQSQDPSVQHGAADGATSAPTADSGFSRKERPMRPEGKGPAAPCSPGPGRPCTPGMFEGYRGELRPHLRSVGPGGRPGTGKLQISWGKMPKRLGTDRGIPELPSGRQCRGRGPTPCFHDGGLSVVIREMASWDGKSHSLFQQVSTKHLLCARHCSRPLMEHVLF